MCIIEIEGVNWKSESSVPDDQFKFPNSRGYNVKFAEEVTIINDDKDEAIYDPDEW